MSKRLPPDSDGNAPELAALQDSLGRLVLREETVAGAWLAAHPADAIDVDEVR